MSKNFRRKLELRRDALSRQGQQRTVAGLSRASQVSRSSVPVGDNDVGLSAGMELGQDVAIAVDYHDGELADAGTLTDGVIDALPDLADDIVMSDVVAGGAADTADDVWDAADELAVEESRTADETARVEAEAAAVAVELAETGLELEAARVELGERLDGAEGELVAAQGRLDETQEQLSTVSDTADEALALAPLTAGELTAVTAAMLEAFIGSAHILDLDVEKLVVTGTSTMSEAVIEKLFTEIVTARVVQITEQLIGHDGTFTGKVTVNHLDVESLFGTRIDGLEIFGGRFIQYATGAYLPIYPTPASHVEVADWVGGPPAALGAAGTDTAVKESGAHSARVYRSTAGSVSTLWRNNGRVAVRAEAARQVEVRFRVSRALTNAHLIVGQASKTVGAVPANTWVTAIVDVPEGAAIEWAHLGGDAAGSVYLYVDRVTVLSSSLVGAHMRIDRDESGIPGLYGYNAASEKLVSVTPTEVKSVVPATGEWVKLSDGRLSSSADRDWFDIPLQAGFSFGSAGFARGRITGGQFFLVFQQVQRASGTGQANMFDFSPWCVPGSDIPSLVWDAGGATSAVNVTAQGWVRANWTTGTLYRASLPGIPI